MVGSIYLVRVDDGNTVKSSLGQSKTGRWQQRQALLRWARAGRTASTCQTWCRWWRALLEFCVRPQIWCRRGRGGVGSKRLRLVAVGRMGRLNPARHLVVGNAERERLWRRGGVAQTGDAGEGERESESRAWRDGDDECFSSRAPGSYSWADGIDG